MDPSVMGGFGYSGLLAAAVGRMFAEGVKKNLENTYNSTQQAMSATTGANYSGPFGNETYSLPGVKPWVYEAAQYLGNKYNIATIGGVGQRANYSEHPLGRALDFMVSDERGTALAEEVVRLNKDLDAMYVIWRQRINSFDGRGWRAMEDRGSPTANHYDHVHVSFNASGDTGDLPGLVSSGISGAGYAPGAGGRHRPVNGYGYGSIHGEDTGYPAVDFAAPVGTPVYAAASGVISGYKEFKGHEPRNSVQNGYYSYGKHMYLKTDAGPTLLMAHLSSAYVGTGKRVAGGDRIAATGNTGYSTGPHLHFGATNGPLAWLAKGGHTLTDGLAMLHAGETVLTKDLSGDLMDTVAALGNVSRKSLSWTGSGLSPVGSDPKLTKALSSTINNVASGGNTQYNIKVNVAGTNTSADDIANVVLKKIERKEKRKPQSRGGR
jgi:hypothetical protein